MKTYRVSIPAMITEEDPASPTSQRILSDAANPLTHALMIGFRVEAQTPRDAARILYERLEATCGDP